MSSTNSNAISAEIGEIGVNNETEKEDDRNEIGVVVVPPEGAPGQKLANLLSVDTEGKIILKSYEHHKGYLTGTARKYLVHFIINVELTRALADFHPFGSKLQEFIITSAQLIAWSKEIAGLFPSESEVGYFSPFRVVQNNRKEAIGKLWDHYNYMKGVLKDEGILLRKSKTKTSETADETVTLTETDSTNLKWLETNSAPLDVLLNKWKDTFSARREILMKQRKTVLEYYSNFLGLRLQERIYMIQADFNRLYSNKSDTLNRKWDLIQDRLISKLSTSKAIRNINDKALLLSLPALTRDQQASTIFHLLPAFAPADRSGKKRKTSVEDSSGQTVEKVTLQELRESFTLRVPTAADLQPELARFRNILRKNGQSCQPMPIAVGTVTSIEACYVVVDNTVYEVKTYIDAIDLTFQIFYVTNCKYPDRYKSLWQLIQKGVYEIDDDHDKCPNWVKFLATELRTAAIRQTTKK